MRALRIWVLPVLASLLALSGCLGNSQPNDKQIQQMSSEFFNQEFQGLFLADEVVKDNGYKKNDTNYVAEVSILSTAQLSLEDFAKATLNDPELSTMEKMAGTMAIGMMKMTLPDFQAGDKVEFTREYLFIKTDNGWLLKEDLTKQSKPSF